MVDIGCSERVNRTVRGPSIVKQYASFVTVAYNIGSTTFRSWHTSHHLILCMDHSIPLNLILLQWRISLNVTAQNFFSMWKIIFTSFEQTAFFQKKRVVNSSLFSGLSELSRYMVKRREFYFVLSNTFDLLTVSLLCTEKSPWRIFW